MNGCSRPAGARGLARIESDASGARMTLSDGRRFEAASAAEQRFAPGRGGALRQPAAGSPPGPAPAPIQVRTVDEQGRPRKASLDQGWTIDYTEYAGGRRRPAAQALDVLSRRHPPALIVDACRSLDDDR